VKEVKSKNFQKAMEAGGFRINDQEEISIIGERDSKEYKTGRVRKRIVSSEEIENFLEKSDNQEREELLRKIKRLEK
jgi:hypothetical protein